MTIDITFNDSGRAATQPSNPKFPDGIDIDISAPGRASCCFNLSYPAPRVGTYSIVCRTCRYTAVITVAGRPDDPRTLTLPCKEIRH